MSAQLGQRTLGTPSTVDGNQTRQMSDTSAPAVLLDRIGSTAVITLNRPDQANAVNAALRRDLSRVRDEIAEDESVRVVIVTGAGKHFCAGADLRENRDDRRASRASHPGAADLSAIPQPVIAAINGSALGGGCELALTCDFRFMAETAQIGLTEIRFGALPRGGGTARLPRVVGLSQAKRLIMTGEPVPAAEAERIGLADWTGPADQLLPAALQLAEQLSQRADYALRTAKALLNNALEVDLPAALEAERTQVRAMATRAQRAAARSQAVGALPAYARIFRRTAGSDANRP
jgi:enoyl-CoA hydratase/carnithine racemase